MREGVTKVPPPTPPYMPFKCLLLRYYYLSLIVYHLIYKMLLYGFKMAYFKVNKFMSLIFFN